MSSMEISEIFRQARERGEVPEVYDPDQLVTDVAQLLRDKGLNPVSEGHMGMATGAAGMMLRAFGILPAGDEYTIDRHNAPDPDQR